MKSKIKIIILSAALLLLVVHPVSAALVKCGTTYQNPAKQAADPCTLPDLIQNAFLIINFLIGSATLLTIGYVLFGGIRMILARGNPQGVGAAKDTMTRAITGLVIVLLAYLIVNFIISWLTGGQFTLTTVSKIFHLQP